MYGISHITIIPMRASPSHKSEMISQLLFGEVYKVEVTENNWLKIKNCSDEYIGWIDKNQHEPLSEKEFLEIENGIFATITSLNASIIDNQSKDKIVLPIGSKLPLFNNDNFKISNYQYTLLHGEYTLNRQPIHYENVIHLSKLFLHTPYLWGGKNDKGIDCSGFSQIVYAMVGVSLPRDAWQQALNGEEIKDLKNSKAGDLAFFNNEEGKITHVGILLNNHEIIHASGKVKIDDINTDGIISRQTLKQSHQLKCIKRYLI